MFQDGYIKPPASHNSSMDTICHDPPLVGRIPPSMPRKKRPCATSSQSLHVDDGLSSQILGEIFGECHQGKLSHPVTPVMWETWKMRIQQDPKHGHVARCRLSKFGELESFEFGEAGCLAIQFISQLILVTYPYQPRFRPL